MMVFLKRLLLGRFNKCKSEEKKFFALNLLSDNPHPAPSFYYLPCQVMFIDQIAQFLAGEFKLVHCLGCGNKGKNWHVISTNKDCIYPEGWEIKVISALSKLPTDIISDKDILKKITRGCRDQFQIVKLIEVVCICKKCGNVRTWILTDKYLKYIAQQYQ